MVQTNGYTCTCCGEYYDELPISYGASAPVYYAEASPQEQKENFELGDELCTMDNEHFFVRGCIEIPIIGTTEMFTWGVWASLSKANFEHLTKHWDNQETLEPMFGWLSTDLLCYPDTVNIKTLVHPRGNGLRPYIEIEPTDHPLSIEFQNGMTLERIQEITEQLCSNKK